MTFRETAPGIHEAHGVGCSVRIARVAPEQPYVWRIEVDWCHGQFQGVRQHRGTVQGAQVWVLDLLYSIANNTAQDAAALAASMSKQHAPEVGG